MERQLEDVKGKKQNIDEELNDLVTLHEEELEADRATRRR